MNKLTNLKISSIIITGLFSITTTVLASYLFFTLTNKTAELNYEIFPIANFKSQSNDVSILNIKVSNSGNKEAEDVNGIISFADSVKILEQKIEAIPKALIFNTSIDSSNSIKFGSPMLNTNEQIVFSFLVTSNIENKKIKIELRGRGLKGKSFEDIEQQNKQKLTTTLIIGTGSMVFLTVALLIFIFSYQRRAIRNVILSRESQKEKFEEANRELNEKLASALEEIENFKKKERVKKNKGKG